MDIHEEDDLSKNKDQAEPIISLSIAGKWRYVTYLWLYEDLARWACRAMLQARRPVWGHGGDYPMPDYIHPELPCIE